MLYYPCEVENPAEQKVGQRMRDAAQETLRKMRIRESADREILQ
jgi:hypothetical protein